MLLLSITHIRLGDSRRHIEVHQVEEGGGTMMIAYTGRGVWRSPRSKSDHRFEVRGEFIRAGEVGDWTGLDGRGRDGRGGEG